MYVLQKIFYVSYRNKFDQIRYRHICIFTFCAVFECNCKWKFYENKWIFQCPFAVCKLQKLTVLSWKDFIVWSLLIEIENLISQSFVVLYYYITLRVNKLSKELNVLFLLLAFLPYVISILAFCHQTLVLIKVKYKIHIDITFYNMCFGTFSTSKSFPAYVTLIRVLNNLWANYGI